jgi:hypothetical protein
MSQRDLILEYSKKWSSLGIETFSIRVEAEHGSKKLFRGMIKITDEVIKSPDLLPNDFNFLGILIKNSGIFCLDIEWINGSVDKFYSLLDERGIDPDSLLIENSMNKGLHLYFRTEGLIIKNEHFKELNGIHFDVLSNFRAFTSPSMFNGKQYEWIGNNFNLITDIDKIPAFPESLADFIDI